VIASNNKLGKRYMLCSKNTIDALFESGITVKSYPYVAILQYDQFKDEVPFKIVFSAPKRTFKRAHERNRIKRICKEAVRLNKSQLESYLVDNEKQLALFLVYSSKEELKNEQLEKKTVALFKKIINKLENHDD
jgi:ribonuclease P protein component